MFKKLESKDGQAIVELAFILPFLLIVVLGLIEFGILFYDQAVIVAASREGARMGITYQRDSNGDYWSLDDMQAKVEQTVDEYLQGRLITFGPIGTITTTSSRSGSIHSDGIDYYEYTPGTIGTLDVAVNYQHTYLALPKFLGWGDTINLSAETIMRLE
jgi:hypothetical protein